MAVGRPASRAAWAHDRFAVRGYIRSDVPLSGHPSGSCLVAYSLRARGTRHGGSRVIQVVLRIAVWATVIAVAYLLLGREVFDSSPGGNPLRGQAQLYLPPVKSPRLLEYEGRLRDGALTPAEAADYQRLSEDRAAQFWQRQGQSVEAALSGVKTGRRARLATILRERGASDGEVTAFFVVLQRDHPGLLEDRE